MGYGGSAVLMEGAVRFWCSRCRISGNSHAEGISFPCPLACLCLLTSCSLCFLLSLPFLNSSALFFQATVTYFS